jgi:lysyl-tRNA synthetase class II
LVFFFVLLNILFVILTFFIIETKYSKKYLDLIVNEESNRNTFLIRNLIIQNIRKFLIEKDFLEVETPILQKSAGKQNLKLKT